MPKLRSPYQIEQEALGRRHRLPRYRQIRVEPDDLTPVEWNNWWQAKVAEDRKRVAAR